MLNPVDFNLPAHNLATSNNTTNHFLGTTQKSWMPSAPPSTIPPSRPPVNRRSSSARQKNQVQLQRLQHDPSSTARIVLTPAQPSVTSPPTTTSNNAAATTPTAQSPRRPASIVDLTALPSPQQLPPPQTWIQTQTQTAQKAQDLRQTSLQQESNLQRPPAPPPNPHFYVPTDIPASGNLPPQIIQRQRQSPVIPSSPRVFQSPMTHGVPDGVVRVPDLQHPTMPPSIPLVSQNISTPAVHRGTTTAPHAINATKKRLNVVQMVDDRRTRQRVGHEPPDAPTQLPTPHNSPVTPNVTTLSALLDSALKALNQRGTRTVDQEPVNDTNRLDMLRKACQLDDIFYIITHAIYCSWSVQKHEFLQLLDLSDAHLQGIALLKHILGSQRNLTKEMAEMFLNFPDPANLFTSAQHAGKLDEVKAFLALLATRFTHMRSVSTNRGCPPCPWEFRMWLRLPSPVLQEALYLSILRDHSKDLVWLNRALVLFQHELAHPTPANSIDEAILNFDRRFSQLRNQYTAEMAQQRSQHLPAGPSSQPPSVHYVYNPSRPGPQPSANSQNNMVATVPSSSNSHGQIMTQAPDTNYFQLTSSSSPVTQTAMSTAYNQNTSSHLPRTATPHQQVAPVNTQVPPNMTVVSHHHHHHHHPPPPPNHYQQPQQASRASSLQPNQSHTHTIHQPYRGYIAQPGTLTQPSNAHFLPSRPVVTQAPGQWYPPAHARPYVQSQTLQQPHPQPERFFPTDPRQILPIVAQPDPSRLALHQVQIHSPEYRTNLESGETTQFRYYRYVEGIMMLQQEFTPDSGLYTWNLELPPDLMASKAQRVHTEGDFLSRRCQVVNGSTQFRLKCMKRKRSELDQNAKPSISPNVWPKCLSVSINGDFGVDFRRKAHYGLDLSTDVTDLIQEGVNEIKICITFTSQEADLLYYVGLEIIRIADHNRVLSMPEKTSSEQIMSSIISAFTQNGDGHEDDDLVISNPVVSIDLVDPFMSTLWVTPVRGQTCQHRECFDLEAFLLSRTSRVKGSALTNPDQWKCPICKRDARPQSLIIDGFLVDVRKQLEEKNVLDTKAILVKEDGTWEVKSEQPQSTKPKGDDTTAPAPSDSKHATTEDDFKSPTLDGVIQPPPVKDSTSVIILDDED